MIRKGVRRNAVRKVVVIEGNHELVVRLIILRKAVWTHGVGRQDNVRSMFDLMYM